MLNTSLVYKTVRCIRFKTPVKEVNFVRGLDAQLADAGYQPLLRCLGFAKFLKILLHGIFFKSIFSGFGLLNYFKAQYVFFE